MASLSPKQKTVGTIVAGVIVAVTPSLFSYLQARDEIKEKYKQNNAEAAAGYKSLVESVKELQSAVKEQHDYIVKLEGHVDALEKLRWRSTNTIVGVGTPGTVGHGGGSGSGSGYGAGAGSGSGSAPKPPEDLHPLPAPDLRPPPPDFATAQMKR